MAFFDTKQNESDILPLTASKQLRVYFAVTVPLMATQLRNELTYQYRSMKLAGPFKTAPL